MSEEHKIDFSFKQASEKSKEYGSEENNSDENDNVDEWYTTRQMLVYARIDTAEIITKVWRFVVIFSTLSSVAIAVLVGFKWTMFTLSENSFIITIIALSVSSLTIGTATKLLRMKD